MKKLHAIISGRVQGVGFRYFVQKAASDRGVTGWTRNLPDGTVEVEAEADADTLEDFRQALWQGPALSRVDDIREEYSAATGQYTGFSIR